jgi:O-succinylbenzoic acid--CoA ligase
MVEHSLSSWEFPHPLGSARRTLPHKKAVHLQNHAVDFHTLYLQSQIYAENWRNAPPNAANAPYYTPASPTLSFLNLFYAATFLHKPLILLPQYATSSEIAHMLQQAPTPPIPAPNYPENPSNPPSLPPSYPKVRTEQCIAFLPSSGSTGTPKLIPLFMRQILMHCFASSMRLGHALDDHWLCCLPLNHIGGLMILWRALFGCIPITLIPKFDTALVYEQLCSHTITLVSLVPTMLQRLIDYSDKPFSPRLRAILLGGAKPPPSLLEAAEKRKLPVLLTWGMTETASQIATMLPGTPPTAAHAGPPLSCFDVYTNPESPGPLWVTGGGLTTPLCTKDYGYIQNSQEIVVLGRHDNILISGGENVQPYEIELALQHHPHIQDSVVFGIEHQEWGHCIVAAVVVKPALPAWPTPQALQSFLKTHLSAYKIPKRILILNRYPLHANGKINRLALKHMLST